MVKKKESREHQISMRVTDIQYNTILALGGPTALLERAIEREAGDVFKLKQSQQQIIENIEKEQQQLQDIAKRIKEYNERTSEEQRQKQEAKKKEEGLMNKNNGNAKKLLSDEEWIEKWKPYYIQRLNEKGELHEQEYEYVFKRVGLKTKEEVKAWVRS